MAEANYRLVAGLGNPGPRYAGTRHNIGFEVLDALSQDEPFREEARGPAAVARLGGMHLVKPLTFMNVSGRAVREWMDWLKYTAAELLVIVDDCSLALGDVRLRRGGSAGGHNGLRSIEAALGTAQYARIRCGIGPVPPLWRMEDFVLGKFLPGEQEGARGGVQRAVEAFWCCQREGIEVAMNRFNGGARLGERESKQGAEAPQGEATRSGDKTG